MQTLSSEAPNEYLKWRDVVFSVTSQQVDDLQDQPDRAYGVIMDVGLSNEFVITITAFASGDSSLRTTVGGGAIGLGGDPMIAEHARHIVSLAQSRGRTTELIDHPVLPP